MKSVVGDVSLEAKFGESNRRPSHFQGSIHVTLHSAQDLIFQPRSLKNVEKVFVRNSNFV